MRGLKYVSWADNTGYGVAARGYMRGLVAAGVDLAWIPMTCGARAYAVDPFFRSDCPVLGPLVHRSHDYDTVVLHTVPEYWPEWIDREKGAGKRVLGYTVWELERLPPDWPAILNRLDGLLVPCNWNVEVFRRSGVTVPIHVVPHISQFEGMPDPAASDSEAWLERIGACKSGARPFIFYTIGFWSHRKAPYLALEAYWRAFDARDDVLMIVKTSDKDITRKHRPWQRGFRLHHPTPRQSLARLAKAQRNPAPVLAIEGEALSDAEMRLLHEAGDCFVSLTRSEGFGLGGFEAVRLGKPVVMTGYGGQLDYLSAEDCGVVPYEMVQAEEPGWPGSYRPGDRWAEPSVARAAELLREVRQNFESARARASRYAARVRRDFSEEATVRALLTALG